MILLSKAILVKKSYQRSKGYLKHVKSGWEQLVLVLFYGLVYAILSFKSDYLICVDINTWPNNSTHMY